MTSSMNRRSIFKGAAFTGSAALAGLSGISAQTASEATPAGQGAQRSGRFREKVVMITGATSGIGEATARAFAAEGACVAFCGRRTELGATVQEEIRAAGGEATYIRADVRIPEEVHAFVEQTVELYGGLDIAFNNAGIQYSGALHETTIDEWDDTDLTNVRGVFLAMKYQIPYMLEAGGGVILVTSSSVVDIARPGLSAYVASKEALEGLVRAAALEYGSQGIRINSVNPGTTNTQLVRKSAAAMGVDDATFEAAKPALGELNIGGLKRIAEPEDIASAVVAMASDDFRYVTGTSLMVDGGLTAGHEMILPELPEG